MALRTGMYSALGDAFDQIRQSFNEAKMFDAQMKMNEMAAQRQHNQDMFNMEMMLEDRRKKQRAAQLFADYSNKLFSSNPLGNRQEELAQIENQVATGEDFLRKGGPMMNIKERVGTRQSILALNSRKQQLMQELNNPKLIADEFIALSSEANRAALEVAQFDPEQAVIFNRFAQSNQDQAKMYIDMLNTTKHGNDKTNTVKVYALPGHPEFAEGEIVTAHEIKSGEAVPLGPFETTIKEGEESKATREVTLRLKETGETIGQGAFLVGSSEGAIRKLIARVAKEEGLKVSDITAADVPQPKEKTVPGMLTEEDVVENVGKHYSSVDPVSKLLVPLPGLGEKMRVATQMASVSMTEDPAERKKIAAAVTSTLDNLERAYWEKVRKLVEAKQPPNATRQEWNAYVEQEQQKLLQELTERQIELTADPDNDISGINYIPDANTRKNLNIKWIK